jgi:hypothetical protein
MHQIQRNLHQNDYPETENIMMCVVSVLSQNPTSTLRLSQHAPNPTSWYRNDRPETQNIMMCVVSVLSQSSCFTDRKYKGILNTKTAFKFRIYTKFALWATKGSRGGNADGVQACQLLACICLAPAILQPSKDVHFGNCYRS